MKSLYELLNELDYEVHEIKEVSVDELERKRIKQNLKIKIGTRKRKRTKTAYFAIASSFIFLTITFFGISFSTNAHQIPIISNIYEYFNIGGSVEDIQENTDVLNLVQESNGIKITVNDGFYDGISTYFTFTIESEVDLGGSPKLEDLPIYESKRGSWGDYKISKINNYTYVGMMVHSSHNVNDLEEVNISWNINKIRAIERHLPLEVNGDWQFNFVLKQEDIKTQIVDEVLNQNGIEMTVMRITYAPNLFNIYYKYSIDDKDLMLDWDAFDIDIEVKDDLGHIYESEFHRGQPSYEMTKTLKTINPEAKQLIISPIVTLYDYDGESEDGRQKWRSINSTAPIKYIQLDDIIVEIERD